MFCNNCGKELSNIASFCPYCGTKTTEKIPEIKQETVNWIPTSGNENENKELPVYKRRNKGAFLVSFIPLIFAIFHYLVIVFMV